VLGFPLGDTKSQMNEAIALNPTAMVAPAFRVMGWAVLFRIAVSRFANLVDLAIFYLAATFGVSSRV
jgi:hypothetical protein